jgi:hypothetical protein
MIPSAAVVISRTRSPCSSTVRGLTPSGAALAAASLLGLQPRALQGLIELAVGEAGGERPHAGPRDVDVEERHGRPVACGQPVSGGERGVRIGRAVVRDADVTEPTRVPPAGRHDRDGAGRALKQP